MDLGRMHVLACSLLIGGCSFETSLTTIDAPPADAPDAAPLTPYWIVAGMSRGPTPLLEVFPFDGKQFSAPCPEQPASYFIRDLLHHTNLDLMYSVDTGFHALSPSCSTITETGMSNVGATRPIQQIVQDPATGTGFFTMDGANAIGVFRFTSGGDGAPTVTSNANATSNAGPLVLDAPASSLFVAGPGIVGGYTLGAQLTLPVLPDTYVSAAMCNEPVRLVLTGTNYVLAFCSDSPQIRRYTRTPFASDTMVGALGAVDQAAALPGDRVVAARKAPTSDLVIVNLKGGSPAWGTGTTVASRVLAIGASKDGRAVVTARVTGPATTELALWRVEGDQISLLAVLPVDAVVNAVAITTPAS